MLEYINSTSVIIFGLVFLLLWLSTRRPSGMPPGPPLVPFFGNALQLGSNVLLTYRKLRKQYGNIFAVYVTGQPMVVLNELKLIKEAFAKQGDSFSDRPANIFWDEMNHGLGINMVSGKVWKEHRVFILNTLREFGMGKAVLESKINEEIIFFLNEIETKKGQSFDFRPVICNAVTNITCSIIFGRRFEYNDAKFKWYLEITNDNISNNFSFQGLVHVMPFLRHLPGDPFRFHKAIANQRRVENELIRHIIEEHKLNDDDVPGDFMAAYIKEMIKRQEKGEDTTMTDEALVKVISDLFMAGSETSTTALRWFVLFFVSFPEVQKKCFEEVHEQIGLNKFASMKDKMELPYVEATIMEVLRFRPIAPLAVPHCVSQDVQFGEYNLPRGTVVTSNLDFVLSDPEIWGDPENFRPERFLNSSNKVVKPEEFIPFGVGRRVCLGEALARMELFLFAVAMIQKFEFTAAGEKPTLEGVLGITHGPKPYKVVAKLRG